MARTSWDWQYLDAQERLLDRPLSPAFTTRFDAEAWLGEHWQSLAAQGVAAARLTQQGQVVGVPVPLVRT